MNIPTFLIPIVVLEALAILVVIWGLWILFKHDFTPDEVDHIAARRRVHTIKARPVVDKATVKPVSSPASKYHEPAGTQAPASPPGGDDSEAPATSSENPSDGIDPSWPAPAPKSS
jgi:hypothetical protein